MIIKRLYKYVLKSSRGISHSEVNVDLSGFRHDRCVCIVDESGKVITGRELPELVKLKSGVVRDRLAIETKMGETIDFGLPKNNNFVDYKLFKNQVSGCCFDDAANHWLSELLHGNYRFVYLNGKFNSVSKKRGGREGDIKAFADSAPIHLINLKTLNYLNSKLTSNVSARNFRPNIIVDGHEPFEEDKWEYLEIDGLKFRVQERTGRCVFTTIDPETAKKDRTMQPLATLAKVRLSMGQRPTMGVGLVPLESGEIAVGNSVVITSNA
ncbi:MOSC domain-containing protein [Ulvibacterium marinum]|uniref:MOSC domain-containing protein n=1 Tax=Ulvibacterium marinum TaxID=2419782 RepID=A0A3B0CF34_9FLAO|nr:MOSC N-terminal beta barrel domain-containing protein [Ulvibacterium marinum]RKN83488.1 MOSC domain-containing protein [Ulvibacterium marinum]